MAFPQPEARIQKAGGGTSHSLWDLQSWGQALRWAGGECPLPSDGGSGQAGAVGGQSTPLSLLFRVCFPLVSLWSAVRFSVNGLACSQSCCRYEEKNCESPHHAALATTSHASVSSAVTRAIGSQPHGAVVEGGLFMHVNYPLPTSYEPSQPGHDALSCFCPPVADAVGAHPIPWAFASPCQKAEDREHM